MVPTINNHKARRDYFIGDEFEAGLELKGTEVKSLRAAQASIEEAFARVENNQVWLYNAHIQPYAFGNRFNVDPLRPRRLLLHKSEIKRLSAQLITKGMAIVPLRIFFNAKGYAKVIIGVGKGKSQVDKRETIKRKEADREVSRAIADKMKNRG